MELRPEDRERLRFRLFITLTRDGSPTEQALETLDRTYPRPVPPKRDEKPEGRTA